MIKWIALHLPQAIRNAVAIQFMTAAIHFHGDGITLRELMDKINNKED